MLSHVLPALGAFIVAVISTGGYAGLAGLMAIESACIPLPSEVILPFAGYLVHSGRFSLLGVATAAAIGCNIGSTLAYFVVGRGGDVLLRRWGWIILVSPEEIDRANLFFARYGSITVLIGRLLPVVRTFIAAPAGLGRMNQLRFQIFTFVGSWLWCLALAAIGERLGRAWDTDPNLHVWFQRFDIAILAAILLAAAYFVWTRLRNRLSARS
jgi:membrane protein DedA with SNARE-associated domain